MDDVTTNEEWQRTRAQAREKLRDAKTSALLLLVIDHRTAPSRSPWTQAEFEVALALIDERNDMGVLR